METMPTFEIDEDTQTLRFDLFDLIDAVQDVCENEREEIAVLCSLLDRLTPFGPAEAPMSPPSVTLSFSKLSMLFGVMNNITTSMEEPPN